jgi:Secretion system C-terminal sorting domain
MMQKKMLLVLMLLSSYSCFGQIDYPYLRIAGMLSENLKSAIPEIRYTINDTFFVFNSVTRSFVPNTCLPLTYTFFDRNNTERTLQESTKDSTIYVNGKIKSRIQYSAKKPYYQTTFGINSNGKIDTSYAQRFNEFGVPFSVDNRSILYRNRFGVDSLYVTQVLSNGIWKLGGDFHEFAYDNSGKIIQAKYGAYYYLDSVTNRYSRNSTHVYTYTGNNLTLRVDSTASSVSATTSTIDRIAKRTFDYDALGRVIQNRWDVWTSASPVNTFTPEQLIKTTAYNAQNKVLQVIVANWSNNAWVDSYKSDITYSNNNLDALELVYGQNNSNWVLTSKYATKYCGNVNASQDLPPLEIKVYPNPVQDVLFLEGENIETSNINLTIFDNKGTIIFQKKEVELPYNVNMSIYPNGFYFIKTNNGKGQTSTHKVILLR